MHPFILQAMLVRGLVWVLDNVIGIEDEATEVYIGFEHLDEEEVVAKPLATVHSLSDHPNYSRMR